MRYTLTLTLLLSFSCRLFGGILPSEWDRYCRKCHIERPVNSLYDPSIKAHKNASLSCVACHRDKGIAGHVKKSADVTALLLQDMTLPPDVRPQKTASAASDDCLSCHFYIWDVDEIDPRKLPQDTRSIALRAAHSQHWDYRTFAAEQRDKMQNLKARKAQSALAKPEQEQLDRLFQIEKMQCSRCHERFKKESPGGIDSNVNIAMKNQMECTGCHIALRTAVHPGDSAPLPTAVSCENCHHGKLHQKMTFFPVDYGTESDCLRCHPKYSTVELRAVKPERFTHKSTEVQKPAPQENPKVSIVPRSTGATESTAVR
jgi:hypothetical protein